MKSKPNIIIFVSGGGSNAKAIIEDSLTDNAYNVAAIFSNNENSGIISYAKQHQIPTVLFNYLQFKNKPQDFLKIVEVFNPQLIVLAGFLKQVPAYFIQAYPNTIINIHPALLPKYGGKGMYGHFIHEAVIANKETESGLTIHRVTEHYDEGEILLQVKVPIDTTDNAESLAAKILVQEHENYKLAVRGELGFFSEKLKTKN
jgi:phosphoribosylglycinamide formyltransferase 1